MLGKRIFDFTIALAVLLIAAPVMLIVSLIIKRQLGSPVIFTQQRPGLDSQPFYLLKFRTMREASDSSGKPLEDHERLTQLGLKLRQSSLDELPSLWNVLKGDMSLVGPRPLLMEYLPLYNEEQSRRHNVRPGITGWAQINGRNAISWDQKFILDVWYVDHWSFLLDLKILFKTVFRVVKQEDIAQSNHVTMSKFTGSTEKD